MGRSLSRSSFEETAARAEALYEQEIRAKLEPENIGKFVVIETQTGDYVVDEHDVTAMKRAAEKHPGGVFHILRVGYRALGRIGACRGPTGGHHLFVDVIDGGEVRIEARP
jgi:hypothetical protein